ncbi:subtilisin-like protein [Violaceomyces palustris]|uniref:Subtilisin-like protein n=1 Tax=Violaceomyces palustris TaxID=1673888 RepID=A0ACD0P5A0_9BASI|nr:subtilisin-like protein [Violaceomyces palustris]
MNFKSFVSLALLVAGMAAAAPSSSFMPIKESVAIPRGWVERAPAPEDHTLSLRINIKQRDGEALVRHLTEISDPLHERYGQHLSQVEVRELLSPEEESVSVVKRWLLEHGIDADSTSQGLAKRDPNVGDSILVNVPVHKARDMLGADFSVYQHERSGELVVRTTKYHLPEHVARHVDFVGGTTYFSTVGSLKKPASFELMPEGWEPTDSDLQSDALFKTVNAATSAPVECNTDSVTADCLRKLYGTSSYVPQVPNSQTIGVAGFLKEWANYADLKEFLQVERPDGANGTFDVVLLNGGQNPQNRTQAGGEANLDIQTVVGQTYPIKTTYFSTGGSPPFKADQNTPTNSNEPYYEFFSYLLGLSDAKLPSVISISYGDDEQTVPKDYADKVCQQIAALGTRGVTVISASGDNGVGSDGTCYTNDGKNTYGFLPSFPASCPYITSVGATQSFSPEVAVDTSIAGFYSGGGFSNYYQRPSYADAAQSAYATKQASSFKGLFNTTGRGYPDVAAQGSKFLIRYQARWVKIGGTSASVPLFSSIVGLLNDDRKAKGKSTLGFLNPLIYSKLAGSAGLNDITSGSSAGCDTNGFPAASGWDAVTGFGTPNFQALRTLTALSRPFQVAKRAVESLRYEEKKKGKGRNASVRGNSDDSVVEDLYSLLYLCTAKSIAYKPNLASSACVVTSI